MPRLAVELPGKHPLADIGLAHDALNDLFEIAEYGLERWGSMAADQFLASFDDAFALISTHPAIGRPRDDVGPFIRSWQHRGYILYYRHHPDAFEVARILHGAVEPTRCLRVDFE